MKGFHHLSEAFHTADAAATPELTSVTVTVDDTPIQLDLNPSTDGPNVTTAAPAQNSVEGTEDDFIRASPSPSPSDLVDSAGFAVQRERPASATITGLAPSTPAPAPALAPSACMVCLSGSGQSQ